MKTAQEIQTGLAQHYGTQFYHRFSILFPRLVLTDGVKYLSENAECFWLMDIIGSVQGNKNIRGEGFQSVTLKVENESGVVIITDGNKKELYKQEISYTDFPLDEIKLFVTDMGDEKHKVVMLTSEY